MKIFKFLLNFFSATLSATAIAAVVIFLKWIKETEMLVIQGQTSENFDFVQLLALQANQFSMLLVFLTIFGVGLGIIGFFGYTQIKVGAEKVSEGTAEKVAKEYVEKYLKDREQIILGMANYQDSQLKGSDDK